MTDWQPGDLALCIKQGPWILIKGQASWDDEFGPSSGDMCTVTDVDYEDDGSVWLGLAEWDCDIHGTFDAIRFVKVTPGTEINGSEVDQRNPWKVAS